MEQMTEQSLSKQASKQVLNIPQKKQRDSNIELLRILAIMGVIVLHYNNPIAGGGFTYSESVLVNNMVLWYLESFAICAVDLFMLISGYFMSKSEKRNLWKIVELVTQVIIFQIAGYLLLVICGNKFSTKSLLGCFLPTNYFVILYCVVFCLSPYIGYAMKKMGDRNLMRMMVVLILLCAVYPTLVDTLELVVGHSFTGLNSIGMYGDDFGYTLINFIMCWTVGAYIYF